MDQDLSQKDDLRARREAMRERLRLQAERVLEAVEAIGAPKSFLEVGRAARAIIATDKMLMQVFREPRHRSITPKYDDGERSSAAKVPFEKAGNAPFVAFGDTFPALQRKISEVESVEVNGVETAPTELALDTELDLEKEAHANAIFAAYCEFKRLEREAEKRFGLGP